VIIFSAWELSRTQNIFILTVLFAITKMKLSVTLTLLILTTTLVGCSTTHPIAHHAEQRVGSHYKKGKKRQCANFVSDVLREAGHPVQFAAAKDFKKIGQKSPLKDGSIVLFAGTYNGPNYITHVGFYNNGYLIHRPTFNSPVTKEPFSDYWKRHFVEARSL